MRIIDLHASQAATTASKVRPSLSAPTYAESLDVSSDETVFIGPCRGELISRPLGSCESMQAVARQLGCVASPPLKRKRSPDHRSNFRDSVTSLSFHGAVSPFGNVRVSLAPIKITGSAVMTLPQDIAAMAESIVNTLTQTDYQHVDHIDSSTGVYDCDCNGFTAFVLKAVALQNFEQIPIDTQVGSVESRPRAFEYYDFFVSLTPQSTGGWSRVDLLSDAGRGDILAWRYPTVEPHVDTGHVVTLAETPTLDASGEFYVVRVYDSAAEAHFDDTRMPDGQPSATGTRGVGSGFLNFKVDGVGRPIAYLFAPPLTAQYSYRPIAIGRAQAI